MYQLYEINSSQCTHAIQECFNILKNIKAKSVTGQKGDESWAFVYERNFIINLAYHYGLKNGNINSAHSKEDPFKRVNLISGEIAKRIHLPQRYVDCISKMKNDEIKQTITVYPDFVIHETYNEEEASVIGQHLILEAKSHCKLQLEEFKWDFAKLNMYINNLGFRDAVYLIINTRLDDIKAHLSEFLKDSKTLMVNAADIDKLTFIIKEEIDKDPQIYKLKPSE